MKHLTVFLCIFSVACLAYGEKEVVKASVKSGNKKFSCIFTLTSNGGAVVLADSKVVCTPNKPTKRTVTNFAVSTDLADYILSFKINPEKLTMGTMGKTHSITIKLSNIFKFRVENH